MAAVVRVIYKAKYAVVSIFVTTKVVNILCKNGAPSCFSFTEYGLN